MIKSFRDLDVYKKSFSISCEIHKTTLEFPKYEQYALANQIRRSTKSICANIAEGFVKQRSSKPEFKRFILIALASCNESFVWIDYCVEMNYIDNETHGKWKETYEDIYGMLTSLHSKIS